MEPTAAVLKAVSDSTQDVYARNAAYWDNVRSKELSERVWLDRLTETLPKKSRLLDLGCGTGVPVAGYFLDNGFDVVGVDYAADMIKIARKRFPQGQWHVADMCELPQLGMFHAVYSWDGFFHLSPDAQKTVLPKLATCVDRGGSMLLTIGPDAGEVIGEINGEQVYHASLAPCDYEKILRRAGFQSVEFVFNDSGCGGRSIVLASDKTAKI